MINKLEVSGVHAKVDDNLLKYVNKKIGQLDKYVSRKARQSMHAEVRLKDGKAKDKNHCMCEVVLHLPHETIDATETTINMYAAVDIVETKLKQQLKKYKDLHASPKLYRRLFARMPKS
jgi:putative sigma-54 modulation protein